LEVWGGAINLETAFNLFRWKHYEAEIILLTVRWYLKYSLSYRDLTDIHAVKCFFKKALFSPHNQSPRVIRVGKNPAYPTALEQLMNEKLLSKETIIRQTKYLNNVVEQDHRFIKKITNAMMGFKSFRTAEQTISGIEAFHMLRKEQVEIFSKTHDIRLFTNTSFGWW
jgi:IS6 family transposase